MIGWGRTAMKKMKAIQAMPAVIALCLALSGCSASKEVPGGSLSPVSNDLQLYGRTNEGRGGPADIA